MHCSDGWDRTSQLCAIAQVLLDPYYRTILGFRDLIEKDFCSFGHLFDSRVGSIVSDDRSPIFLQFLDVVWHIMRQFPTAFEFTEVYLIFIADASFSRCFSTFLGDSERERLVLRSVRSQTPVKEKGFIVGTVSVIATGSPEITAPLSSMSPVQMPDNLEQKVNETDNQNRFVCRNNYSTFFPCLLICPTHPTPSQPAATGSIGSERPHLSLWEYFDRIFDQSESSDIYNKLYKVGTSSKASAPGSNRQAMSSYMLVDFLCV